MLLVNEPSSWEVIPAQGAEKMLVRRGRALVGALTAAAVLAGACSSVTATEEISGRSLLFIGNSLTYANDLPAMLARVAEAADDSVRVAMVAGPNLAVIDHVNGASDAVAEIGRGGWSFVVLQQGPGPAPRSSFRGPGGSSPSRWRPPASLPDWRRGPSGASSPRSE